MPVEMVSFYKQNIRYIEESAVNPDKRRYIVPEEAPRHYIDLDVYGDSATLKLPRYWKEAAEKILRLSADLGHYVADAHVPLHTK